MKIKYVGPFYRVSAEGFLFIRDVAVEVPEAVARKLLGAHLNDQLVFVPDEAEDEVVAN